MEKRYLTINDISSYKVAINLSHYIWDIVIKWDYFAKDTVGKQYIRAVDSIAANIAEGFGRYFKKEKIQFYRYSYGSIAESLDWTNKAYRRHLLSEEQYKHITNELEKLPQELHNLIKFTDEKLKK